MRKSIAWVGACLIFIAWRKSGQENRVLCTTHGSDVRSTNVAKCGGLCPNKGGKAYEDFCTKPTSGELELQVEVGVLHLVPADRINSKMMKSKVEVDLANLGHSNESPPPPCRYHFNRRTDVTMVRRSRSLGVHPNTPGILLAWHNVDWRLEYATS